ncbi:MAG: AAA family ATPase, partial [Pirellulales bacterium]
MRPLPPTRLENGAPTGRNRNPIQRWPDRDGYRAAERFSDVSMMPADEVPETTVRWLWPGTIAVGHLTLVAGEPGSGKSFWMADLAARITFARPWPYRSHHAPRGDFPHAERGDYVGEIQNPDQGSVVYVNSDDSFLEVQRPRLAAAEAQLPMVGLMRRMPPGSRFQQFNSVGPIEERLRSLKTAIQEAGDCKLAIVDDLARFVRDGLGKVTRADLMLALESLKCLSAECDVAMVVVWRLERTARATARYLETFLPSAATAWLVGGDPYGRETRWAVSLKNQFGPPPQPMAFHIADDRVVWDTPPQNVPADVMAAFVRKSERRVEREHAGKWALARLADEPVEATELFDDAEAFGFSRRTVRRALVDLGLKPTKQGNDGPWVWMAERKREKAEEGSGFGVQGSGEDARADGEPSGVGSGRPDGDTARRSVADGQCKMQNAKCKMQNDASGSRLDSEDLSSKTQELRPETLTPNPKSNPGAAGENPKSEDGQLTSENQSERTAGGEVDRTGDDPEFDPIIREENKVED